MEAKRLRQEETESEAMVDNLSATIHSKKRKRDLDEDYAGDTPSVIVDKGKKQCNIQSNKRKHARVSFKLKSKEGSSNKRKTKNGAKRGKKENANKKKNISANLISRQSPYQLVQILKSLTDRQKAVLREIGFGSMVDFSIKSLPMSLALLLVDRLDAEKCEMMVGEKLMKITKKDVHEILGFPMGNREVKSVRKAGLVENDLAKTWKRRFPMPKKGSQFIKLTDVSKKIKDDPEAGSTFKFDIPLSIVTVMAEGITCGTINQRVRGSINDGNDIKDMDWCGYVIDCLKRSKDKWSKDSWYAGPLTFLVVWYAQHISKRQKGNPAILHWTTKELKLIEQMELSGAKFDEVPYAGDGDEDLEYNNETNLDDRESTINEKASEVEFDYQTIKNHEERKQVFINGMHKAYDNLHKSNEQFISELKSCLANFPGDLDVIEQVNIVKEKWLTDLGSLRGKINHTISLSKDPGSLRDVHEEDSEDEVDDDVADLEERRMLDDFIDVTLPEKKMTHLWNKFKRKQGLARARNDPEESQPQIYEETNALALVVWSPPIVPGIPLVSLEAKLARAQSDPEESQPQIHEETNALALVVWSPRRMPGIPLVSREANYSRDSDLRVHLSEEEQRAAEESLARYCPLLEFYNVLKHRASKNPSFLTRCLSYKLKDKHKKRLQILVSINRPLDGGRQTQSLFPLYILLARPVLTPNGETPRSSSYRFNRACKLPAYRGAQTVASPQAKFVLPEINKLAMEIKSGSLALLLVSCADVINPTAIDLTKDHMFTPSYEGYCLMGKIPIDFLQFSREQSRNISLGVRAQFTSTVSLKSCYMKLSYLDEEKRISFHFPRNSEAVSILQQVPVSITAEELGAQDLTRYDLHSYNNIPADKLSQVIRLRTGNVIFNYKYYNNMLHKSEVTEDYCCPICLLKCASYKGLRYHLPAYHDLFNYEFWVDDNYQAVIISPTKDAFTPEGLISFGQMIDPRQQSYSFCRKPLKSSKSERRSQNPNRVSRLKLPLDVPAAPLGVDEPMDCEIQSPNAVVVSRPAAGISSSGRESTPQSRPGTSTIAPPTVLQFAKSRKLSIERSDPRNKTLLQKGSFFHSHTGQPMALKYVLGDEDSEDEVDDDVADLEDRRMLDDFIDVTPPEKKIMHLWNSFKRKQGVLADAHVPWACEAFSTQHGKEIIQTPSLRWGWRIFMIKLWQHGLLDNKAMNRCNLVLEGFKGQNQSQPINFSGNES